MSPESENYNDSPAGHNRQLRDTYWHIPRMFSTEDSYEQGYLNLMKYLRRENGSEHKEKIKLKFERLFSTTKTTPYFTTYALWLIDSIYNNGRRIEPDRPFIIGELEDSEYQMSIIIGFSQSGSLGVSYPPNAPIIERFVYNESKRYFDSLQEIYGSERDIFYAPPAFAFLETLLPAWHGALDH